MHYAIRALAHSPLFTLAAILTLALGIGANAALFSIADPLLLRPLPVDRPGELVRVRTVGSAFWSDAQALVPYPLATQVERESRVFAGTFVVDPQDQHKRMRVRTERGGLGPPAVAVPVSGAFFEVLGVGPVLGRVFTTEENRSGAPPLAVLSYGFWQRQYGGRPDVIGELLSLDPATGIDVLQATIPATIVGVAPRGFHGVELDMAPDVWLTITPVREASGVALKTSRANSGPIRMMARLRSGVSLAQAQAEIDRLAAALSQQVASALLGINAFGAAPGPPPHVLVESAATGVSSARDRLRSPLLILIAAVACVLLLACANVAALVLARAAARHRDLAVRLSLGSSRLAIVRLLLTEGVVLATGGAVLGLLLFAWVRGAVIAYLPAESSLPALIGLDARLLGFTVGIALLSVLLCALAPALWISRLDLQRWTREPHGTAAQTATAARVHTSLIPVQVAVALVLLVGAGLFLRTLQHLRAVDTGVDRAQVIQFGVDQHAAELPRGVPGLLPPTLVERLGALPGVEAVTYYSRAGLLQHDDSQTVSLTTRDTTPPREAPDALSMAVGPRFFETTGIPLLAGRGPNLSPLSREVVLSASLARYLFGQAEAAVGRSVISGGTAYPVVGVAGDAPHVSVRDPHVWMVYTPNAILSSTLWFAVRATGDVAVLAPAIRATARDVSVNFDIVDLRTFHDITEASIAGDRLVAEIAGLFGLLALILAAIGISGLVAYAVAQRTAEIGLRMALGAQAGDVIRLTMSRVLRGVAGGLGLGLGGVGLVTPLLASQLFGVAPYDPATVGLALLGLLAVAGVAAYLPARRAATHIDPIRALRGH